MEAYRLKIKDIRHAKVEVEHLKNMAKGLSSQTAVLISFIRAMSAIFMQQGHWVII